MTSNLVIGFDWDGTLVESFTSNPLPGVHERLHALPGGTRTFIATNQAGPVFRAMLRDTKYPTVDDAADRIASGLEALDWRPDLLLICTHPGRDDWDMETNDVRHALLAALTSVAVRLGIGGLMVYGRASFRKPAPGMLLEAARHFGTSTAALTFVGDMDSDAAAARAAGARFQWAVTWRSS